MRSRCFCIRLYCRLLGDQLLKLEWPGYGFSIEVPKGAHTPGVTASVSVKVILGGQFQLSEGCKLISDLYCEHLAMR